MHFGHDNEDYGTSLERRDRCFLLGENCVYDSPPRIFQDPSEDPEWSVAFSVLGETNISPRQLHDRKETTVLTDEDAMTLGTERENIFSPRGAINYLLSDGIPSLYARIQIKWYEIIRFFSHVYKKKQRERSERNHVCQQNYNGHSKQCYTCSCCGCHNVSRQSKRVFFSETKDGQITMGPLLSSTKSLKILGKGCKLKKKKKKSFWENVVERNYRLFAVSALLFGSGQR